MKKLLVLLTVAVGIFCFSSGAFAQLLDVCSVCKNCSLQKLTCPSSQAGTCEDLVYACRAIFSICNCENAATSFVSGHRIGIRLTILINGVPGQNGAYWADPASATVPFSMYKTLADACVPTTNIRTFGPGRFFKTLANGTAGDQVTTLVGINNPTCAVPAANQATMIATNPEAGYLITDDDELNKLSRWYIPIPRIHVDGTVLQNCETIQVKIEALDQNTGGICADCVAVCSCIIDVGTACCKVVTSGNKCLFPYFTSTAAATAANPFWNGIALVNTSSTAGTVTLKVYEQDGSTGTFTTPSIPAYSMFVATLENISFTGTGLGGSRLYIQATSTFGGLDGFGMIANVHTGESMGYLCRKPSSD